MGKLVLFRAGGTAQDIRLDRERITIGRRPDNDVCLAQPAVSGEHAAVVTILSDSFLEDLGSTNGTRVNGNPINKHFLCDGDEIEIGRQVLVYVVDDSAILDAPPKRHGGPKDRPGAAAESPVTAVAALALAVQRDKRRAEGAAAVTGGSAGGVRQSAVAESEGGNDVAKSSIPENSHPASDTPADPLIAPRPEIRVLSGAHAGRSIALTKDETLIGRAGVQVAALRRDGGEIRLVPVEGSTPPRVNGAPVAPEGSRLAAGDVLEVAGARLEFVVPSDAGG